MPLKSSAEIMQVITSWLEFIDKKKVCLRDLTVAIKECFFFCRHIKHFWDSLIPKAYFNVIFELSLEI